MFRMTRAAAAGAFALSLLGSGAMAASISFTNFSSTNAYSLSPTVEVNDDTAGQFDVSVSISAPDVGSLIGVFLDLSPAVAQADITDGSFNHTGFANGGNVLNLGGGANMSGGGTAAFDIGLKYAKADAIGLTPLTFSISDLGGTLTLADFTRVGLRFQESNNNATQTGNKESDKLVSTTIVDTTSNVSIMPLPAGAVLLLTGLGALGLRRKFS